MEAVEDNGVPPILETEDYNLTVGECWNSASSRFERGYTVVNKQTGVVELEHCQLGSALDMCRRLQDTLDAVRVGESPTAANGPLLN